MGDQTTDRLVSSLLKDPGALLLCHVGFDEAPCARAAGRPEVTIVDLDTVPVGAPLGGSPVARVAVLARTLTDLRRAVTLHALLPKALRTTVMVARTPHLRHAPLAAASAHVNWRTVQDWRVTRVGERSWSVDARFSGHMQAGQVLLTAARAFTPGRPDTMPQPVAALAGSGVAHWRPADPNATLADVTGPVPARPAAPGCDLALRTVGDGTGEWSDPEVTAAERPGPGMTDWARFGRPGGRDLGAGLDLSGPSAVPPVDERSVNPAGFSAAPELGIARLTQESGRWHVVLDGVGLVAFAASGCVTDDDVARLRPLRGISVDWRPAHTGPVAAARVITGLAAAGVPLTGPGVPTWAAPLLGGRLAELLGSATPERLADDLHRQEHSVELRRCALRTHGSRARWEQLAAEAGLPRPAAPSVSVLLATRRPDMVPFALSQVARQRGVDLELVLSLHGISASAPGVAEAVAAFPHPVTVYEADAGLPFGTVLNEAAARASGAFLTKMDDDDWYGPDHLADQHLALLYTGADLTGTPAEFVYLEQIDTTVQRHWNTETWQNFVAGGTLFMPRNVFEDVGGFRPIGLTEDGQLLQAVQQAGGRIYQGHGLGYILRRQPSSGHTWKAPIGNFLDRKTVRQWRGFHPGRLMEPDGPR
ncbi:glycosyltransferase [Planomonospora sp. ID67723]|uniref:glycosyltransferase family A protein n=1 Tax=Planomonospora sp. ID67723 TaxID=2738134 RepID=UPI0018C429C5|nr:glycosyltransferase family A protein [Planomonospora sp. ID67723]MBG0828307.1 glycosyltransferase [Planomonospora sp. ID67723]